MKKLQKIVAFVSLGLLFGLTNFSQPTTNAHAARAEITMSDSDFDGGSILFDPYYKSGSSNIGGSVFIDSATIPLVDTDAIGFRIKNLTNVAYPINHLRFENSGNISYVLRNSVVKFVTKEGVETTYTGSPTGRNTLVPASFDGIMIVDWNQVVNIRHPLYNGGAYYWSSDTKLSKSAPEAWNQYPTTNYAFKTIFFNNILAENNGVNELLFGDVYTFNYTDTSYQKYDNPFTLTGENVIPEVEVSYYPTTQATYSFEVNGVAGTSDVSIDLNVTGTVSVNYGFALDLNPTITEGYILSYIEVDDVQIEGLIVRNMVKTASSPVVNYVTAEMYSYTIGEDHSIGLSDKVGVQATITNELDEAINFSFIMTDSLGNKYTASDRGVGIFSKQGGYTYYGNVFSIPVDFEGSIFIPFNAVRGSTYGGINNLPWDVAKPSAVTNIVRLSYVSSATITAESLETVFSNWEFITSAPTLSNAPLSVMSADYENGLALSLSHTYSSWDTVPVVRMFLSQTFTLDGLGIGIRLKNKGSNDISVRPYFYGSNGVTYVPTATHQYTRYNYATETSTVETGNRSITIPAGFDGTFILNMAYYSSDTLTVLGTDASNIKFANVNLSRIMFYMNMTAGDYLFVSSSVMGINNEGTAQTYTATLDSATATVSAGGGSTPSVQKIMTSSVTSIVNEVADDGSKVTVSHSSVTIGDTIIVTPKRGYQIDAATLDGAALTENLDGTFSKKLTTSYVGAIDLEVTASEIPGFFDAAAYAQAFLNETGPYCEALNGAAVPWGDLADDYALLSTDAKDQFVNSDDSIIAGARERYEFLVTKYATLASNNFVVDGEGTPLVVQNTVTTINEQHTPTANTFALTAVLAFTLATIVYLFYKSSRVRQNQ